MCILFVSIYGISPFSHHLLAESLTSWRFQRPQNYCILGETLNYANSYSVLHPMPFLIITLKCTHWCFSGEEKWQKYNSVFSDTKLKTKKCHLDRSYIVMIECVYCIVSRHGVNSILLIPILLHSIFPIPHQIINSNSIFYLLFLPTDSD